MKIKSMAVLCMSLICFVITGVMSENATSSDYLGCYKDQGDSSGTQGRDLNGYFIRSDKMTPAGCSNLCSSKGFKYAGVQYGSQCFCGMNYGSFGKASNCDYQCTGDSSKRCGGFWANSVYSAGSNQASKSTSKSTSSTALPTYSGTVSNQNGASLGGGGANGYAKFYRNGTLQISGEAWSDSKNTGTRADIFVILEDGLGRALYISNSHGIPTACGKWDASCSSSTRGAWTDSVPAAVAPYIRNLDVYIVSRGSNFWRDRVNTINGAVKAYNDLDPAVKSAIAAGIAAM